ncbi:MAG: class I SAM-dependent methyltransferase [Salinivirgaceae bacterium]|nr:class I SAM-dependent methyltransferase [Salinivirgaceae bacterium]
MIDFWESMFKKDQIAWGFEPSDSAIFAKDLFLEKEAKDILIPGIGYGRNANVFHENGMKVTGIEISKSAIDMAKSKIGHSINIHHGSVTKMPFDNKLYDGIFCYALIHLLNKPERKEFIKSCYHQLKANGYMIFTVISKKTPMYGSGKQISSDRFKMPNGLNVFYYDSDSVEKEFENYGLVEYLEIQEPIKFMKNKPPLYCILIKCKRHQ